MKQIQVTGMSCQHCVQAVTKALEGLGLADVSVSLEKGLATFAPTELSAQKIIQALDDIGFEAGDFA